jgi:hypothetical protein
MIQAFASETFAKGTLRTGTQMLSKKGTAPV